MANYQSSYTGSQIDTAINRINTTVVPTKTSDLTNDSGFVTSAAVPAKTSDLTNDSGFITNSSIPTKLSDLTNDAGFITSTSLPTKVSDLTNDVNFITLNFASSATPANLGVASPGTSNNYARADHVHNAPNIIYFDAYYAGSGDTTFNGVIPWNTIIADNVNAYSSPYYTIPENGIYIVGFSYYSNSPSSGRPAILKNNSQIIMANHQACCCLTGIIQCVVGDRISAGAYSSSFPISLYAAEGHNRFQITKIF